MTTIRPVRRTARRRRLPHFTLSTTAAVLVLYAAVLKTWPIQVAILTILGTAFLIVRTVSTHQLRSLRLRSWCFRIPLTRARGSRTLAGFHAMSPDQFEQAVAELARRHPAVREATTHGGSGDRGLDVLAELHDGRRILIQCKRYQPGNNVGGPTVRETVGSVIANGCTAGVIVTTAGFTAEAIATNRTLGPSRLALVDGSALVAWASGGPAPWAVTLRTR